MFVNDSMQFCNTYFESEHIVYAKHKFVLDIASYQALNALIAHASKQLCQHMINSKPHNMAS